jgi:hypothetical protein
MLDIATFFGFELLKDTVVRIGWLVLSLYKENVVELVTS